MDLAGITHNNYAGSFTAGAASAVTGTGGQAEQDSGPSRIQSETGLGRDEFLRLLVAQLQHQDPLEPLDASSFIAELAQFASLEALHRMDEGIGQLNTTVEGLSGSLAGLDLGMGKLNTGVDGMNVGLQGLQSSLDALHRDLRDLLQTDSLAPTTESDE